MDQLFSARSNRSRYLRDTAFRIPGSLADKLAVLSIEQLEAALGEVLDRESLQAILKRRNLLLKTGVP